MIHPAIADSLPALVAAIRDHLGDRLARIVLFGSAIRDDFTARSDIDVAVMLATEESPSAEDLNLLDKAACAALPPDLEYRLEMVVRPRSHFERCAAFPVCFEGQVMHRGCILYDDGRPCTEERLTGEAVRRRAVQWSLDVAASDLHAAEILAAGLTPDTYGRLSVLHLRIRACCHALQAILLWHGVDPSPRALRWNVQALYRAAAARESRLLPLGADMDDLPPDLTMIDQESLARRVIEDPESLCQMAIADTVSRMSTRCIERCREILSEATS